MKEYHVIKKYVDVDEDEGFYVEKIKGPNKKDITSKIDKDLKFDDDDDLVEYLAEIFNQDPDDMEIIEDETLVEYSSNRDIDPEA